MGEGELWIRSYLPGKLHEIPQAAGVLKLAQFVNTFKKQKKKAMLLYGPSGTCKTSAVHALARELGRELIEVNASDTRNAEEIGQRIGQALKQQSLFSSSKIVLIDEIDGVSGDADRGGIPALADLVVDARFPVILTAQDPWDKKFSGLRSKCVLVEFPPVQVDRIVGILQGICAKEGISADIAVLKALARRAGGDLRAAINDLQLLACGSKRLSAEDLDLLGERNRLEQMETALVKVFKNSDPLLALGAFDNTDTDIDEVFLWIDHNLPKEYPMPEDLSRAYEVLSRADLFRGRIRRQQHWRFLSHIFELLTAGVAVAKDERSKLPPKYEQTTRLLKIWMANQKYNKRRLVAQKIAEATHCSTKTALHHSMPWLQVIIKSKPDLAQQLAEELGLDEEEVEGFFKQ